MAVINKQQEAAMISKKKILIPIVGQGSITHIIRTGMLDKLCESFQLVVALQWQQDDLVEELKSKGVEVVLFPEYKVSAEYASLRYKINLWYIEHKLKTPSVNIQQKYLAQFKNNTASIKIKKEVRAAYHKLRFKLQPRYIRNLVERENEMMKAEQAFKIIQ